MQRISAAIANNVQWCDLVCRAHDVPTTTRGGVWLATEKPPELYPDAITTQPGTTAATVAGLLKGRPGSAVKDSWADMELSEEGFVELFSARWISHEPAQSNAFGLEWSVLDRGGEFGEWEKSAGLRGLLTPELLSEPQVRILSARREGTTIGGAIMNRTPSAVGVSNVFSSTDADRAAIWDDIPAAAGRFFPRYPLVGYEHGADLGAALAAGFAEIGSLRIWLRP